MHALRKALATVLSLPATVSVLLVRTYQVSLSPDHGPLRFLYPYGYCRHEPTCSAYAIDVLRTKSYPKALFLIAKRVLSCHPWKKLSDEKIRATIRRTQDENA